MTDEITRHAARICVIGAAILWGSSYPAIGVAAREAGPLSIALLRGLAQSLIVITVFFTVRPSLPRVPVRWWLALGLVALLGGSFNVGQSVAVSISGASAVGFVAGLYPLVAIVAAALLARERLASIAWVAVGLGGVGAGLVAFRAGAFDRDLGGLAMAALAALAFGLFLPASRALTRKLATPPLLTTLGVFLALSLESLVALAAVGDPGVAARPSGSFVVAMVWLVVAAGVLPLVLVEVALRSSPTSSIASYLFLAPVVSALLGAILLDEVLSPAQLLGGCLVIAALLLPSLDARIADGRRFGVTSG